MAKVQASRDSATVWIPDVISELSGETVLVMEHSPGTRIDRYAEEFPKRRVELANEVATLILHQVFETGLFHADPHPGNLFVLPDGRLCLHDFGSVGELDRATRAGLSALLNAVVHSDARDAVDAYLDLGLAAPNIDRAALESEVAALRRRVHERPLAELSVGETLESLLRVGARHRIRNPGSVLLLTRALLIAEALMASLDPTINVVTAFGDELERLSVRRFTPARIASVSRHVARDTARLLEQGPADLRRTLRRIADGELGRVHAPEVEETGRRVTRGIERLTGATASAALLVAGSLLVVAGEWHRAFGDALLLAGVAGSVAVAIGALRGHS